MGRAKDLTGLRLGRLLVIKFLGTTNSKTRPARMWECLCDCGKSVIKLSCNLMGGDTKSCGCLVGEGLSKRSFRHGLVRTRVYRIYKQMKTRCYNQNYFQFYLYGGRGIKICDFWLNPKRGFIRFYSWSLKHGYDDTLTIDRIDVNGDYSPKNCKWSTYKEQSSNKRK